MKLKFQTMSTLERSSCSQEILKLMRHTVVGADDTVKVDGVTFNIHRTVVGWLSPKFHDIFLKNRQPTEQVREIFDDVTSEAFSVVLDFAYGLDVETNLSRHVGRSLDVRVFAALYGISELKNIADEAALKGMNTVNCPRI